MDRRLNFKSLQLIIAEEFKDKEKVIKASKIGKITVESSISLANQFLNVYVSTSECIFLDMFACIYVSLCLCVYLNMFLSFGVCLCMCVCVCVCVCVWVYVFMCVVCVFVVSLFIVLSSQVQNID